MARIASTSTNFADCLTVGDAAKFLGVSAATLRNWDRSGKLKPRRHPQNGYRIYLHEDLQAVLRFADLSTLSDESAAPQIDWSKMRDDEHFVQFYENDEYLIESVSAYVGTALRSGDSSIVIAAPAHRAALEQKLVACGVRVGEAETEGRYIVLDAAECLSSFMVGDAPNGQLFQATIGNTVAQLAQLGRRIHAFGEMVALLWADGKQEAAIELEQLWNALAKQHRFALFCAYPIAEFSESQQAAGLAGVCSCHSRVIPAESYAAADTQDKRLRAITLLQQQAQSLDAEIQHRKEVEKVLSKRERELSDFFDNALEGLHKVGPDGTILWANKADYELLGYSAEEYIGQSVTNFHADAEVAEDMLQRLRRGETLVNFPARMRCKNGVIKHVLVTSNACFDEGAFLYTRCFTRDVTEQWGAEKALIEGDRRKDEFLATLSHELRNPLAPIRNALHVLDSDACDANMQCDARGIIKRQVDQMARLVDDLLDISRITRDKIELRKEIVDVMSLINSALETTRPAIDAAKHQVNVNAPTKPLFINVDPARFSQVFSNLLNNATKYTEAGGVIDVTARQEGGQAVVSVQDNGIGIECEELAHVFDMFRQVDQSLEKSRGGLGIGLTLVRRLVELHGGSVNAQSEGPGKGCEFTVRMPLAVGAKASKRAPKLRESKEPVNKHRILVVDDNRDAGQTLAMLLRVKGHDVELARDGLEAVAATETFRPNVIFMDVGMPKLNGYEATERIRKMEFGKEIVIVALTGWGQASDVARSLDAGCTSHLVKPVEFADVERLLAAAPIMN